MYSVSWQNAMQRDAQYLHHDWSISVGTKRVAKSCGGLVSGRGSADLQPCLPCSAPGRLQSQPACRRPAPGSPFRAPPSDAPRPPATKQRDAMMVTGCHRQMSQNRLVVYAFFLRYLSDETGAFTPAAGPPCQAWPPGPYEGTHSNACCIYPRLESNIIINL